MFTAPKQSRILPPPQPGEIWVAVSITEQRVRIYKGRELLRDMIASTGRPDAPTPIGTFTIQNRGYWFFSPKFQQGGYYWVSFKDWGVYLFHSIPADAKGTLIPEEAEKLGEPASHGCVRLSLEDSRWFYENVPQGTRVEIF